MPPKGQVHIKLRGCSNQAENVEAVELGKETRKQRELEQRSTVQEGPRGNIELNVPGSFPLLDPRWWWGRLTCTAQPTPQQASAVLNEILNLFCFFSPINNERHQLAKMPQNLGTLFSAID